MAAIYFVAAAREANRSVIYWRHAGDARMAAAAAQRRAQYMVQARSKNA